MKKALLLTLLWIIPCVFFAQERKIHTKEFSYNTSLDGFAPYRLRVFSPFIKCSGTYQFYYDDNDNVVMHGLATAQGTGVSPENNVPCSGSHSAKVNYKNGNLNGNMSVQTSLTVVQERKITFSYNANFTDGVPNGSWAIKHNMDFPGWGIKKYDISVLFNNGKVNKYQETYLEDTKDGKSSIVYALDFSGGGVSGNYKRAGETKETRLKYGFCTNKFIRLSGEISELEDKEYNIINEIIAKKGKVNQDDYIEKGYCFEEKEFCFTDDLLKFTNGTDYADYPYWSEKDEKIQSEYCKYYMLKKIKVDIIDQATAYGIIDGFREKKNAMGLLEQIERIKQSNQLLNHYIYKRDKESILSYADSLLTIVAEENRIAYEKQKEQERLAEERRKEELRIAEEKRKEELRIAEEKRKEELRIAEEKRKEEERLQKEYDNKLSNFNKVDNYIANKLWTKKANSKDFVPVKGLEQEAQTYKTIRKELGLGDLLKISTYKDLSNLEKENVNKSDTFLYAYLAVIYPGSYIDTINNNATQIAVLAKTECADVGKEYKAYFKGFPFDKSFSSYNELMKYYQTITKEVERQEECKTFIHARKSINENNVSLKEHYKDYKDIAKDYSNYISNVDLSWNKDVSVGKLQGVLDLQNNLKEFVDVRKQITNHDKEILATGKKAKNVIKLYSSYLSSQDLTWSQDVTKEKLSPIVELQQALLNGLKQSNIEEIDKTVKAKKITTITEVLTLF